MVAFTLSLSVWAEGEVLSKTPGDVFVLVEALQFQTKALRERKNIRTNWPSIPVQHGKSPRHVYQKGLEVLDKISRLRRIEHMGPVTVPVLPSRKITPEEVYELVLRLTGEIEVFTKGEVTRFLRMTQNLPMEVEPSAKTEGKHPNHALAMSYRLLEKIALAEKNLWMDPVKVPVVPKRVIKPEEVYDSLLSVMAELLAESDLDEEQRKYVDVFRNAGETLLTLINTILDISKIESGQLHRFP